MSVFVATTVFQLMELGFVNVQQMNASVTTEN